MKIKLTILMLQVMVFTDLLAQTGKNWYYNMDENNLAISGYDPVAYFALDSAMKGSTENQVKHEDVIYQFISAEHKEKFLKSPEKYLPAYGGWCAYAAAINIKANGFPPSRFPINPNHYKIVDDRLLLFARLPNFDALNSWNQGDEKEFIKQADAFWESRKAYAKMHDGLPEGMNPNARMENLDWQKLIGTWKGSVQWMTDTTSQSYSPEITAKWKFYYGFNGYCIQDDWFPDRFFTGNGIWAGPAIRGYDPNADEWHMTYIPINSPRNSTWMMTARFNEKGEIEGEMESVDANGNAFTQKIYFYDISEDKFHWKADRSYNNGKTWIRKIGKSVQTRIN